MVFAFTFSNTDLIIGNYLTTWDNHYPCNITIPLQEHTNRRTVLILRL